MTSQDIESQQLTVAEAAALLRIQPATVRLWIKQRRIDAFKNASGHWRITRAAVDRANGRGAATVQVGETDARN